jgi:hypothetical protein
MKEKLCRNYSEYLTRDIHVNRIANIKMDFKNSVDVDGK